MDALASRIALTVRVLSGHKNLNFEATTSISERDLSTGAENSRAETLRIWKIQNRNFMVVRVECAIIIRYVTGILKSNTEG
jgi:hypothetical protein